jgi:hypothetical protein
MCGSVYGSVILISIKPKADASGGFVQTPPRGPLQTFGNFWDPRSLMVASWRTNYPPTAYH